MTSKRFEGHEQAAAKINYYNDGSFELVSYSTTVITIDKEGWLHINGLYSRTTIKHIGWFMKMIGLSYQTAKQLLYDNMNMNIHTGEVKEWD
jgi:hypothetical protein